MFEIQQDSNTDFQIKINNEVCCYLKETNCQTANAYKEMVELGYKLAYKQMRSALLS